MSIIPSLSVWSSVKFPFPKYFPDSKITQRYSVESCDDFIKRNYEKSRAERAPEMINLRVPFSKSVEKENSVPNLYCECTRKKQNSPKPKKKPRHIRFVVVPQVIFYDKECAISNKKAPAFKNVNLGPCGCDCILGEKEEEIDVAEFEEKRRHPVPSVKPWTLEELVEINRQKEEAKKKMGAKKNKIRKATKNRARALETSNGILRSHENLTFYEDSTSRDCLPNFTKHYGDCELYRLGLTSHSTEKVHKTRREEE